MRENRRAQNENHLHFKMKGPNPAPLLQAHVAAEPLRTHCAEKGRILTVNAGGSLPPSIYPACEGSMDSTPREIGQPAPRIHS